MADMTQNDPNSALGQIQALLGNYGVSPEERKKTIERRDLAQQQYLGVLQEPMPDQGAINRMVNDYLMRYAKQPNQPAASAIAAIGAEGQRSQEMAQNQLLRRQLAAEQEAKMAGEALKEADLFAKGLLGGKLGIGKQPSPEQLRTVYTAARNEGAQIAKDYKFESAEQREQWIENYANRGVQNYIERFAVQPLGPRGEQPAVTKPTDVAAPAVGAPPATPAQEEFDLTKIKIAGAEKSNQLSDKDFILQQEWDTQQQIINRFGLQSPQGQSALAEQAKIKSEMRKGAAPVQSAPQAATQPTPAVPTLPAAAQPAPQAAALTLPTPPKPQAPLISPALRDKAAEEGRKQELGEIGKGYAKQYNEVLKGGMAAETTLNSLENIERNLEGYTTGKLTPMTTEIAAWARPFGLELDKKLSNKEAFKKVVGQMTLNLKNVGGENNMPGSLSDSDRKFLEAMAPSLSDTPEGNRLVIDYYKRVAQRQREMAAQSEAYFDKNGTYKGFRKEWDEYAKANPLFGKSEQPKAKRIKITPDMLRGG